MRVKNSALRKAFEISTLCIFSGHVGAVDLNGERIFREHGWEKIGVKEIKSEGGPLMGDLYAKVLEGKSACSIHLPGRNIVWFGWKGNDCVFIKDKIMWVGWIYPASLLFNDVNVHPKSDDELKKAIISSEARLKSGPRGMTKIRRYKGAFGLIESNDGEKFDLTFGLMRIMKDYRFKGANLEITVSGGPGDRAVIELTPDLGYISSSVNGKPVDPEMVESSPAITEEEYRHKRDEKMEARRREILKSPEEAKPAPPEPSTKLMEPGIPK